MSDTDADQRATQRRQVIQRRAALSQDECEQAGKALASLLTATPEFQRAEHVSAYWPVRGEIDVRPVMEAALATGKQVYLPVLAPPGTGETGLLFAPYTADTPMVHDRYGIPEPDVAPEALASARDLDLAIVPLVLFDDHGHRVGMGGGYYDRTFGFTRGLSAHERPWLVAAAHEWQRTDRLHREPWDVAMDVIVTDEGIRRPVRSNE